MTTSFVPKPRSMPTGARNVLRSNDSASLWNCTLSPGWSREEADILRNALMKFGVGNWKDIVESGCLPGKNPAQLNLQTQRMLGQQSTAEFAGLHIDSFVIGKLNAEKQGDHIKRKNGFIVNTGAKLSREEIRRRVQENREKFEVPREEWEAIELPKAFDPILELDAKRRELADLQNALQKVQEEITKRKTDTAPTTNDAMEEDEDVRKAKKAKLNE